MGSTTNINQIIIFVKKIIFYLIFTSVITLIFGFEFSEKPGINNSFQSNGMRPVFTTGNPQVIPDVMNYINVIESDGIHQKHVTYNLDSFPNFPAYPINVTGTSFEGGIFCNMDSDPQLELVYAVGTNSGGMVYAWKSNGTLVPGWPKSLSYPPQGAPAFGDIIGDGQGEIVVGTASGSSNGLIYAFHKDGSPVTGFPINHGYTTRTIVLADLDNNGIMEIITNKRLPNAGEVWVYRGDGTVYPGWPKPLNHVPASSSAVGDINGDGIPEIIAESYNSLYAFDKNGNTLPGFPFTMPNGDNNSYSSPVLVNLNNDNKREIVFGTHKLSGGGWVYVLNNDGTMATGWPKSVSQWIYGPPAIGYINQGNVLDIAIGDQVLSFSPTDYLYAWDKNGNSLPGFPVGPVNAINNQVCLGDINNDNNTDLIIDDNTTQGNGTGKYLAFNHDGSPMSGWPIITQGTTFFYMPCLLDINNTGTLDICGGASVNLNSSNIYLWNTGSTYNASKIYTPMWQYNTRHNGVFEDRGITGITPVSSQIPKRYSLSQNYPNPFNPTTKIKFDIPSAWNGRDRSVKLTVYNILGKEVATIVNQNLQPGSYEATWNATNEPSGVYFYKIMIYPSDRSERADGFIMAKKMILIK